MGLCFEVFFILLKNGQGRVYIKIFMVYTKVLSKVRGPFETHLISDIIYILFQLVILLYLNSLRKKIWHTSCVYTSNVLILTTLLNFVS